MSTPSTVRFLNAGSQPALEDDVSRRRLQKEGDLRSAGGFWRIRWREDQIQADGSVKYAWTTFHDVGRSEGRGAMTEKQARREAWDKYLSHIDANTRTSNSVISVRQFVERRFIPEHFMQLKPGGRAHYETQLRYVLDGIPEQRDRRKGLKFVRDEHGHYVLPASTVKRNCGIGNVRLREVRHEHAQKLISEAILRGYGVQTGRHIKNCISAIFTFAEKIDWFSGKNPAKHVGLPEMVRKTPRVLTFQEFRVLSEGLKPMAKAMVLCAALTSMNIAEVCGLRWKRVNLTAEAVLVDGESIPAFHVAVREQWYLRQWGSVKAAARRRNLPLPKILVEALSELQQTEPSGSSRPERGAGNTKQGVRPPIRQPDAPVFSGSRGTPVDAAALLNRQIRPAAKAIGAEKLGWHDLRRSFATWADQLGMSPGEIQTLMGHARFAMTMHYTKTPSALAIEALEKMGNKVKGAVN